MGVAADVLGVDKAEASDWLLGYSDLPSRKGTSALKSVRRCTPILRVKAHLLYQWKDVITAAYFASLGMSRDNITLNHALQLLHSMAYLNSVRGLPAVVSAIEALLVLLGEGARVQQPVNMGDQKIVTCSIGHVALVTAFVRVVLEVVAGLRPARGAVGEGIHDVWVVELPLVDNVLPRDTEAHSGLRLVDGADPARAEVPDDDDDALAAEVEEEGGGGAANNEESA